jgi:adenine-specific DNA-methyltransferase
LDQRLLTATFPYYELKEPGRGPGGGVVYKRKQNRKGEEVGGLVPHITLKSIANNEEPKMEVLVDRPEEMKGITRVAGPFTIEATIPAAAEMNRLEEKAADRGDFPSPQTPLPAGEGLSRGNPAAHIERMLEFLRRSETLRLPGNETLHLQNVRRLTDTEHLHAEAMQPGDGERRVAIVFGPEDGAIVSDVVFEAAREAYFLKHDQLFFFGFAIQAKARELIGDRSKLRIPCTYVAVTPDVVMSDLLKTTRSSEIFSVTGLPDIEVRRSEKTAADGSPLYEVELKGLDIFNPADMETEAVDGRNLPAWMLDTDYNDLCFYAA